MTLSLFWHLIKLAFKQQLAYRLALWSGLATNLFFGILRAVLLIALYGERGEVNGLSLPGAITYVGLTQAMIAYLLIFGSFDLMNTIISGAIGVDLLKPVSLFAYWLGRDFGRSLVNLFGRGVLFVAAYSLFFPVQLPNRPDQWLFLVISLVLAWLVNYSWRFLLNLAAFWSPDARGILRIGFTLTQFLSGFVMPLQLLPDWFSQIVRATPFPSMVDTSVQIFLGTLSNSAMLNALWLQFFWFLALAGLSEVVLRAGVRRLVIQGG